MRGKSSAGSFQQSFLDLLFGTLGAVVLLFVLISITSGPPPRPLTPVSRYISWKISSEELPAADFALYCPRYAEDGILDLKKSVPLVKNPTAGEWDYTKQNIKRTSSFGRDVSFERLSEDVLQITVEVPSDDLWVPNLALFVWFEQELVKRPTVTVEATPGDISKSPEESAETSEELLDGDSEKINEKEASGAELGNCLRIETSIELKEVGDSLVPFMDASKFIVEFDGEN